MSEATLSDAFDAWADGSVDDAAAATQIVDLLRTGVSTRRDLVECALLEVALYRIHPVPRPPWWRRPVRLGGWRGASLLAVILIGGLCLQTSLNWQPVFGRVSSGHLRADGCKTTNLRALTEVEVSDESSASVQLKDGSTFTAEPGSRFRIKPLNDDGRAYEFFLHSGRSEFHLIPGCRSFTVLTPYGDVQAVGPHFSVEIDTANKTLKLSGATRLLGKGQS